jgi:hypothetical protein
MHYVPPPVISPLGLKKIDFKFNLKKYKAYVVIYTHPNGTVDALKLKLSGSEMTVALSENTTNQINKQFSSYINARSAILQAANRSPFLARMLNAFYGQSDESKFEFDPNAGTRAISTSLVWSAQRRGFGLLFEVMYRNDKVYKPV